MKPLLAVLALVSPIAASEEFDFAFITFDEILIDPDKPVISTSSQWGLLVNTGTEPLEVAEWSGGLAYSDASPPFAPLSFTLGGGASGSIGGFLQPGEAMGNTHPLLLAELEPHETLVHPNSVLMSAFLYGGPYPDGGFTAELVAQARDRIVRTTTTATYADLGGDSYFPLSARRWTPEPSSMEFEEYGDACTPGFVADLRPAGEMLPKMGNELFGFTVYGGFTVFGADYVHVIDLAPAAVTFQGCELLVGFTPNAVIEVGTLQHVHASATVFTPIPTAPAFNGVQLYFQGAIITPLAGNGVWASTQAFRIKIGQ